MTKSNIKENTTMAETKTEVKVVEKKDGKFKAWWAKHGEAVITGLTCAAAFGTLGYIACNAVHHEHKEVAGAIDAGINSLAANSEAIVNQVPVNVDPAPEIEAIQDPSVDI